MSLTLALLCLPCALLPTALFIMNLGFYREPDKRKGTSPEAVSVLIPARNEAIGIAATLRTVLTTRDIEFEVLRHGRWFYRWHWHHRSRSSWNRQTHQTWTCSTTPSRLERKSNMCAGVSLALLEIPFSVLSMQTFACDLTVSPVWLPFSMLTR